MATEKKRTAKGNGGKARNYRAEPFNTFRDEPLPATEAWYGLEAAYEAFRAAALQKPGDSDEIETLDGMRRVLRLLATDDGFRHAAIEAADKHARPRGPKGGNAEKASREQERRFLSGLERAIERFPGRDDLVAAWALSDLPRHPALLSKCHRALPGRVTVRDEPGLVRVVEHRLDATPEEIDAAVEDLGRVVTRERTLNTISERDNGLVLLARAILRHLGCPGTNSMFRRAKSTR